MTKEYVGIQVTSLKGPDSSGSGRSGRNPVLKSLYRWCGYTRYGKNKRECHDASFFFNRNSYGL